MLAGGEEPQTLGLFAKRRDRNETTRDFWSRLRWTSPREWARWKCGDPDLPNAYVWHSWLYFPGENLAYVVEMVARVAHSCKRTELTPFS